MSQRLHAHVSRRPAIIITAGVFVAIFTLFAGAAFGAKAASNHFADNAFRKLGTSPDEMVDRLTDKLVDKIASKNGPLSDAQKAVVARIARIVGAKLKGVDPTAMLEDAQGKVVDAGLGKVEEFDVDALVDDVTASLIARGKDKIDALDLESLAGSALDDAVDGAVKQIISGVDLEKIVREQIKKKLDGVDVEAVASKAIREEIQKYEADKRDDSLLTSLLGG